MARAFFTNLFAKNKSKKQELNPQEWPSLNISIDDFRYGKRSVGKVELQTTKIKAGLKINKLNVAAPLFYVKALGLWGCKTGQSKTTLSGQFISHNLGALLKQWGVIRALEGGEGVRGGVLMFLCDGQDHLINLKQRI